MKRLLDRYICMRCQRAFWVACIGTKPTKPPPPLGIGDGPYICPLCFRAVRNKLRQACNPSGGSGAGEWCRFYFSVVHYFTTCPGISYDKGDFTVLYSINITECAHAISFFYSGDYVSHVMVTWLLQSL